MGCVLPTLSPLTTSAEIHKALSVTPAMETGMTSHVWNLADRLAQRQSGTGASQR